METVVVKSIFAGQDPQAPPVEVNFTKLHGNFTTDSVYAVGIEKHPFLELSSGIVDIYIYIYILLKAYISFRVELIEVTSI